MGTRHDKLDFPPLNRIIHNRIRCLRCGDVIESVTEHDFKTCSCGRCSVDGGKDYIRRCGNREDWEELSVFEEGQVF